MGNPKEQAVGQQQGDWETFLKNYSQEQTGKYNPNYDINAYKTQGLDLGMLNQLSKNYFGQAQSNLFGQQQRATGGVGALASNQAFASGVSNPYAFGQHASNGIFGQFANAFGNLNGEFLKQMMQNPQTAFSSQLGANQANFENFYRAMLAKGGLATQRDTGFGEQLAGGVIGAGTKVGSAYLGK